MCYEKLYSFLSSVILPTHSDDDEVRFFVNEDLLEGFIVELHRL
jgi:hypothetical protein